MKKAKFKNVFRTAAAFLLAAAAPLTARATGTAPHNWYVDRSGGSPRCPGEMRFIEERDCFYVDPAAAEKGDRVIYLTFDAGYENGNIAKILDVLEKEDVKGAFFILKNLVARSGDLVERMIEDGHTVCNHTASHRDMTACGDAEFAEELEKMENVFREATGRELAKFYRPPEGRLSEANLESAEKLGYTTVLWSFAYADWDNDAQPDPAASYEKIMKATHPGEIILLHPTSATNAAILEELIEGWRAAGYRFGTLEELRRGGERG